MAFMGQCSQPAGSWTTHPRVNPATPFSSVPRVTLHGEMVESLVEQIEARFAELERQMSDRG